MEARFCTQKQVVLILPMNMVNGLYFILDSDQEAEVQRQKEVMIISAKRTRTKGDAGPEKAVWPVRQAAT